MASRSMAARIAAYAKWSKTDAREGTRLAREGFRGSFLRKVDPAGELPDGERRRRADAALKAHMLQLAARSAAARRRNKTAMPKRLEGARADALDLDLRVAPPEERPRER